jgi:hypothetical protein
MQLILGIIFGVLLVIVGFLTIGWAIVAVLDKMEEISKKDGDDFYDGWD